MKTCPGCGKGNDDAAAFCIYCGTALPQGGPSAQTRSPPPTGKVLEFGTSHGQHKFILGSVDFVDETGAPVYTASRESALHENYTITQADSKVCFMKHKLHLGGYSFELQDGSGTAIGVLRCESRKRGVIPKYWFEDRRGDTQAILTWEEGAMAFAISDLGQSQTYAEAVANLPGGIRADLEAMGHHRFTLSVPDGSALPIAIVLAFCVAVANMPV